MTDHKETLRIARLSIYRKLGRHLINTIMRFVGKDEVKYHYVKTSIDTSIWLPTFKIEGCITKRVNSHTIDNHGQVWWTSDNYDSKTTTFNNKRKKCVFNTPYTDERTHIIYDDMPVYIESRIGGSSLIYGTTETAPSVDLNWAKFFVWNNEVYVIDNVIPKLHHYDKSRNTLTACPYKYYPTRFEDLLASSGVFPITHYNEKHKDKHYLLAFCRDGDNDWIDILVVKDNKSPISVRIPLETQEYAKTSAIIPCHKWGRYFCDKFIVQINRQDNTYISINLTNVIEQLLSHLDNHK